MKPSILLKPARRLSFSVRSATLALSLTLILLHSPRAQAQGQFTPLSRCLGIPSSRSSCIECGSNVMVLEGAPNCSRETGSLVNRSCSRLQDVLDSISTNRTRHRPGDCIRVVVSPRRDRGPHVLVGREGRVLTQSVLLVGTTTQQDPVQVTLELDSMEGGEGGEGEGGGGGGEEGGGGGEDGGGGGEEGGGGGEEGGGGPDNDLYALRFSSDLAVLSSLEFVGSPGSIAFDNTKVVVIEDCSFRFFSQGAVDVYNSDTVLVTGSNFSHNVLNNVSKPDPYRGHSAGLSLGYNKLDSDSAPYFLVSDSIFRNNSVEVEPVAATEDPNRAGFDNTNTTSLRPPETGTDGGMGGPGGGDGDDRDDGDGPGRPMQDQAERFETRGQVFGDQILTGRGGGVAMIINANLEGSAEVSECLFLENVAAEFGGGMYVLLQGSQNLTVTQNSFEGNVSPSTGGGLHVTFISELQGEEATSVYISQSDFSGNSAVYGGGLFILPLTLSLRSGDSRIGLFVRVQSCVFRENAATETGAALGASFVLSVVRLQQISPIQIRNCTFTSNSARGAGIVSIASVPTSFYGNNVFSGNRGSCLAVVGALVRVFDALQFINNEDINSLDGGALYVSSLGQIELNTGTSLVFSRNTGTTGSAIVIKTLHLSRALSRQATNPLCAFIFADRTLPPDQWQDQNVSVLVRGNKGIVGSGVSLNNVELCSWTGYQEPFFSPADVFNWTFIEYHDNINIAHGNPREQRFAVQTPPVELSFMPSRNRRSNLVRVSPGERYDMQLFAFDELGVPTAAVVGFLDDSTTSSSCDTQDTERYRVSPSSATLQEVHPSASLEVRFRVRRDVMEYPREEISIRTVAGIKSVPSALSTFNFLPRACSPGRVLQLVDSTYSECVCDEERPDIVDCDRGVVTTDDLLWSYSVLNTEDDDNLTMFVTPGPDFCPERPLSPPFHTIPCPRQYCSCVVENSAGIRTCNFKFDRDAPFDQCRCNRTGILCGDCQEGSGFSALLNTCKSCDSSQALLILGLILIDTVVIVLVLFLMLPMPAFLYPTLFYLQLLPHLTDHFPITFEKLSPYFTYVGSALGMYFPYDFCLHSNMGAVPVYALRYIPILLAVILAPGILHIRVKKFRPTDWHGAWNLLLLLYTPILHTSISLLNCPTLEGEPFTPRWYVNANIKCFQDPAHAPVGVFAIAVLIACLAFIPLTVLAALGKLSKPFNKIHHLITPLTAPYKDKYRWWCGVELAKRVVLVLFAVAFKKNDYAVIFTLISLLAVSGFFKPYKSLLVTALDAVYLVDIFVLLCIRNTVDIEEVLHEIPKQTQQLQECGEVEGYSQFTTVLGVFYYIPLVLGVGSLGVWGVWHLYRLIRNDCIPLLVEKDTDSATITPTSASGNIPARARTQTVVDMKECEPSSPHSPPASAKVVKKFSFRRLTSRKKKQLARALSEPLPENSAIALQELHKQTSVKEQGLKEVREEAEENEIKSPLVAVDYTAFDESDSFSEI